MAVVLYNQLKTQIVNISWQLLNLGFAVNNAGFNQQQEMYAIHFDLEKKCKICQTKANIFTFCFYPKFWAVGMQ